MPGARAETKQTTANVEATVAQSVGANGSTTGTADAPAHAASSSTGPGSKKPASPAPAKLPRWALLDALRLVAALAVVLYHYVGSRKSKWGGPVDEQWPVLHQIGVLGNLGVPLFFIISGLVVFRSLEGRSTARFIGSRVGRVMPAFWVSVLIAGPLQVLFWDYKGLEWKDVFLNMTLVAPPLHGEFTGEGFSWVDIVYWTLWIEARFYIMLVLARWAMRLLKLDNPHGWTAFAFSWVALSAWVINDQGVPELQSMVSWLIFPTYAGLFAGGMVIHLMAKHGFTWTRAGVLAAAVVQSAWATALDLPARTENATGADIPGWFYALAVVGCFATILAIVMVPKLNSIRWKWLTTAGALTFPVYLLHGILGRFAIESLAPWMPNGLLLALLLAATLGAAWVVNRAVEVPFGGWLVGAVERVLDRLTDAATARRSRLLLRHVYGETGQSPAPGAEAPAAHGPTTPADVTLAGWGTPPSGRGKEEFTDPRTQMANAEPWAAAVMLPR